MRLSKNTDNDDEDQNERKKGFNLRIFFLGFVGYLDF